MSLVSDVHLVKKLQCSHPYRRIRKGSRVTLLSTYNSGRPELRRPFHMKHTSSVRFHLASIFARDREIKKYLVLHFVNYGSTLTDEAWLCKYFLNALNFDNSGQV